MLTLRLLKLLHQLYLLYCTILPHSECKLLFRLSDTRTSLRTIRRRPGNVKPLPAYLTRSDPLSYYRSNVVIGEELRCYRIVCSGADILQAFISSASSGAAGHKKGPDAAHVSATVSERQIEVWPVCIN